VGGEHAGAGVDEQLRHQVEALGGGDVERRAVVVVPRVRVAAVGERPPDEVRVAPRHRRAQIFVPEEIARRNRCSWDRLLHGSGS
ncbi:Os06g0250800, partial [Oryza sativa Japonica Group]